MGLTTKWKTTIRKENWSTMILLCCQCHHEIEVIQHEGQKCDWCGGDMVVIGEGTVWPDILEYRIIAKEIKSKS